MAQNRRGGIIFLRVNGEVMDAAGNFTYNLGRPKKTGKAGASKVEGYTDAVQIPFIEGAIVDKGSLDLAKMIEMENATVTLQTGSGKTVVLRNAWYAADGDVSTEEGEIQFRAEGLSAEET